MNLGRSYGPATALLDKLRPEVLYRSEYNRLNNHVKAVDVLKKGNTMAKVLSMPNEDYEQYVEIIHKHNVKLDQARKGKIAKVNVKEWLLLRRLYSMADEYVAIDVKEFDAAQVKLVEFWDALRIWRHAADDSTFDISNVRLRDVVDSLTPKAAVRVFNAVFVKHFMVPMIAHGDNMADRMRVIVEYGVQLLENVDTVALDKQFSDVIISAERMCKAVKVALITDLSYDENDIDDMEVVMKAHGGKGVKAMERFADALDGSEFYKDIIEQVRTRKALLIDLSTKFVPHSNELGKISTECTVDNVKALGDFATHIVYYKENVGYERVQDFVEKYSSKVIGICGSKDHPLGNVDSEELLNAVQNMMSEASIALSDSQAISDLQDLVAVELRTKQATLCEIN